ncbi:MAG: GNAT family N-acetyltransferase [Acidimicrobiales bacterium]
MAAAKPTIEVVTAGQLEKFAARALDEATGPGAVVPISLSRAQAWAANPQAGPDEPVLLVASLDGRCVGYLGMFPTLFAPGEPGVTATVSWLSAFFVLEELRGQAVGALLLMQALSLGRSLAVAGPAEEAAALYAAVGFKAKELPYFRLDVTRERNWLGLPLRTVRKGLQKAERPVPAVLDRTITGCARGTAFGLNRALAGAARRRFGPWQVRPLDGVPDAAAPPGDRPGFVRDAAVLDWMLASPWVTTDRARSDPRYYFDDFRQVSIRQVVELRPPSPGAAPGWAVVSFDITPERRKLQLLDAHVPGDPEARAEALTVAALRLAVEHGATQIVLPADCGPALARLGRLGSLFAASTRVDYHRPAAGSPEATVLAAIQPSYLDGDSPYA